MHESSTSPSVDRRYVSRLDALPIGPIGPVVVHLIGYDTSRPVTVFDEDDRPVRRRRPRLPKAIREQFDEEIEVTIEEEIEHDDQRAAS